MAQQPPTDRTQGAVPEQGERRRVLLQGALGYAAAGYPVLPVHVVLEGQCSCGKRACDRPAKHPRTEHGLNDASVDRAVIKSWWERWPDANIGVAVPDGMVVLDFDTADVATVLAGRDLPTTANAKTGRGSHHWYRTDQPMKPQTKVLDHLDIRAPGSYVVVPPSMHASGVEYSWVLPVADGVAAAPDWLLEVVAPKAKSESEHDNGRVKEGARNVTLTAYAGAMRRTGAPLEHIEAALLGLNATQVNPPLDEAEVRRVAHSIARYSRTDAHDLARFEPTPLDTLVAEGSPPMEYADEAFLYRGHVTSIHGPSGHGKTLLAVAEAARAMERGLRVAYLDEENGAAIIAERLGQAGGLPDVVKRLFAYFDFRSFTFSDADLLLERLREFAPELVIFDSAADFYAAADIDENDNSAVTRWAKVFPVRIARQLGAAVLLIEAISANGNSSKARGASAKRYKADVEWSYSAQPKPARDRVGMVTLTCSKDRLGLLPKVRRFHLGGDPSGRLVFMDGGGPSTKEPRDPAVDLQARVLSVHHEQGAVSTDKALSRNVVHQHVRGNRRQVLDAIAALVAEGSLLQAEGRNKALLTSMPERGGSGGSGTTQE